MGSWDEDRKKDAEKKAAKEAEVAAAEAAAKAAAKAAADAAAIETAAAIAKEKAIKLADKEVEIAEKRTKALKEQGAALEDIAAAEIKVAEAEIARAKATEQSAEKILELEGNLKKLNKTQTDSKKATDAFSSALGNTIKTFTGVTDSSNTLIGSFANLATNGEGLGSAFKEMGKTIGKTFTTLNVGVSIMQKVTQSTIGLAIANDSALASFNKTTGAAGHYNAELIRLEQTNRSAGISTAELGDSYSSLISGVSGFGIMAESQRMELGALSAQYGKVGVSASDFAGILQSSTNMMGLGATGATQMQEAAFDLAQELGRNVSEVFSELNQALPKLALYSGDVTEMFGELQEQAHATGMAVGELMDMAGAYRTFDSAAEAAGNLNAVLGTQLFSTMDMLEAQLEGPAAVMEYMTDNLSNSIGDWNTLNTFQKEAVANAANMSVESMATLMNQRDMTEEQRREAVQIEDAMATARSMGEEMKILMAEFAVAIQPIFNFVKGIVSGISAVLTGLNSIHPVVGGLTALFMGMALVVGGIIIKHKNATRAVGQRITMVNTLAQAWKNVALQASLAGKVARGGASAAFPNRINPPSEGGGVAAKGLFSKMSGAGFGIGLGASILGDKLSEGAEEGSARDRAGGAVGGAGKGAMFGSMFGVPGALVGGALGGLGGALGLFAEGTDSTPRGPAIVGEEGPELLVPSPGSAVVNNSTMTALANGAGGGDNAAVVAAVRALGAKMDTMITKLGNGGDFVMQVNNREFGRVINEHLGEDGFHPINLRTV